MRINYLQKIIDVIRGKEKKKDNFGKIQNGYLKQIVDIKKKIIAGKKIRVGFLVIFDSVFPGKPLYESMLRDDIFEPFIVVIPDISRGEENKFYQLQKTYDVFAKLYGESKVFNSYNKKEQKFVDYSKKMDLVVFANPYDHMTHSLYSVFYLSKYCLTINIPYAYTGSFKYNIKVYKANEFSSFWKIFVGSKNAEKLINENRKYDCNNVVAGGYLKMDSYKNIIPQTDILKNIIIAPHHTVRRKPGSLNISNFIRLADFYLELPKLFPNINFIFRPHPIMFVTLKADDLWGEKRVNEYIEKMKSYPNVIYQEGGEYFQTFADSTALIHDCGSFLSEYFYTKKPQLFIYENDEQIQNEFTEFGQEILDNIYTANTEAQIIDFINNVVINENDDKKQKRINFAEKNIMINYPIATQYTLDYLKSIFTEETK